MSKKNQNANVSVNANMHKKNANDNAKEVILNSLKHVDDAELMKDLDNINIEQLTVNSAKGRSIWKNEFKLLYHATNMTTARRKIRKDQLNLSKNLLASIIKKESKEVIEKSIIALYDFYVKGLTDFTVYSNISKETNIIAFETVHKAYTKMLLFYQNK